LFNGSGSYQTSETPASSSAADPNARVTLSETQLAGILGIRHVLVQSIVDVSATAALFVSYRHLDNPISGLQSLSLSWAGADEVTEYGLQGGLAAERALIDRLALRLSLEVLSMSIANGKVHREDSTTGAESEQDVSGRTLRLSMRPSLALYFYF
jgi:hypothetical protein